MAGMVTLTVDESPPYLLGLVIDYFLLVKVCLFVVSMVLLPCMHKIF
jgi:hypothetical protein